MDKREKAKELFNNSGIIDNAYNWHIWKRAFDLGVAYDKTSDESESFCVNCDRKVQTHNLCMDCVIKIGKQN